MKNKIRDAICEILGALITLGIVALILTILLVRL